VGLSRFELETSTMSTWRSNQLSYKPLFIFKDFYILIVNQTFFKYIISLLTPKSFLKLYFPLIIILLLTFEVLSLMIDFDIFNFLFMFFENQEMNLYILSFFVLLLFIWNIVNQFTILKIKKNQAILFGGKKTKDLEQIILENQKAWKLADTEISDLYEITTKIHELAHLGLHKVGMIRFNPFRDIGGDQSFAIALLDGENNGLIISSIYSRDGVRVYTKAIQTGLSKKYQLTEEEKKAIEIASSSKSNLPTKRKK
jgi:hypothetical protein